MEVLKVSATIRSEGPRTGSLYLNASETMKVEYSGTTANGRSGVLAAFRSVEVIMVALPEDPTATPSNAIASVSLADPVLTAFKEGKLSMEWAVIRTKADLDEHRPVILARDVVDRRCASRRDRQNRVTLVDRKHLDRKSVV